MGSYGAYMRGQYEQTERRLVTVEHLLAAERARARGYRFRIAELEANQHPEPQGVTVCYAMRPDSWGHAVVNDVQRFFERCAPRFSISLVEGDLRVRIR